MFSPKVNLFLAKRNRDEHFKTCLHYLNEANKYSNFDVHVYVISDDCTNNFENKYDHIEVIFDNIIYSEKFNKSRLLNHGIAKSRKDWDWFSIIDIDMIYNNRFFEKIKESLQTNDYVVCNGYKLDKMSSDNIIEKLPNYDDIKLNHIYKEFTQGPSQISINEKAYQHLIDLFDGKLYNERCEGWGAEDSIISEASRLLDAKKFIKKSKLNSMWYHMHHDNMNTDPIQYNKNFNIYKRSTVELRQKIMGLT